MKASYPPNNGKVTYLPSILILDDSSPATQKLKQQLETNGCQVCRSDIASDDSLAIVRRKYFDIIVLNLERPDMVGAKIRQKLKTDPELTHIPVVMLTAPDRVEAVKGLKESKVYYLPKFQGDTENARIGAELLQIIEQIHYLTDRYA